MVRESICKSGPPTKESNISIRKALQGSGSVKYHTLSKLLSQGGWVPPTPKDNAAKLSHGQGRVECQ